TARLIKDVCKGQEGLEYFAAHLSGADFAVVLAHVSEREALEAAERLVHALPQLQACGLIEPEEIGHIRNGMYHSHRDASRLLAEADMALRAAQAKGANAVHLHASRAPEEETIYSATHWTEFLRKVIDTGNIVLHMQPVLNCSNKQTVLQYETLLRTVD